MKREWSFSLLVSGVFLWIFGLIYNIAFAGIPYPDPTPEQAADFAFHAQIAVAIFWAGLGVFVGRAGARRPWIADEYVACLLTSC